MMDCRSAAFALTQIATLLELHNEDQFSVRAMQTAARVVASHGETDLGQAMARDLAADDVIAPAAIEVLRDLATSNGSALLERLQEETPEGLLEMLRVLGLSQRTIAASYTVEFALVGVFSSALGVALGFAVHNVFVLLLAGLVEAALPTATLWPVASR